MNQSTDDVRIIAMVRGNERYVIVFRDASRALCQLGRWTANPELSFDWGNAVVMTKRIREQECVGK